MDTFYFGVVFRRLASLIVLTVWVVFALVSPAVEAQGKATTKCEIKITSPSAGNQVGARGKVEGEAKIPAGSYLWVLAHVKFLKEDWWPQGRKAVFIDQDGTWGVLAGYGGPQDKGEDFEIALAVVNEQTNEQLRRWVEKAEETKKYPPLVFPSVIDGCPPYKITVKKTSDD